jgi:cyanate permease
MLGILGAFHIALSFAASGWAIVWLYALLLPVAVTFSAGIPAQTIVSRWFIHRVGLAMGLSAFGLAIAGVLFPSLIVWLLPMLGWRTIWRIFAGVILLVILPLVLVFMRDRPTAEEGAVYLAGQGNHAAKSTLTVRQVFSRRNFWVAVAVFVPIQCASISMTVNLAPIVTSYGFSAKVAGLMIAVLSISALSAKLVAGAAADRFGNRVPMIVTALLCAAGLGALINSSGNLPLLVAAFVLIGLSAGVWTLLASATAAEFGREGFGRAFGLICMFPPVASLAPPMVARLKEISGNYTTGLSILCGLAIAGACAALLLREERPARRSPPAA